MKYKHIVVKDGVWYNAGDEVPEANAEAPLKMQYTKTDINRMSVSDLRDLARKTGVDSNSMTGAEIKEYLITLFGL